MNTQWHLQRVLLAWLRGEERDEEVYALRPTPDGETRVTELPIGDVARALADDPTLLPDHVATGLGLAPDATFATVAGRMVAALDQGRDVDQAFRLVQRGTHRSGFATSSADPATSPPGSRPALVDGTSEAGACELVPAERAAPPGTVPGQTPA